MLKGIDPLLTPDLLHALASAGHGDVVAVVDANFPAARVARQLVALPGSDAPCVTDAILSVLPIDDFLPDPVRRMQVVGDPDAWPEVQKQVQAELGPALALGGIERFAFYEAAKASFAVVQVGDPRPYGCFLFRKGVIAATEQTLRTDS